MMHARRCSLAATLLQFLGNSVRTVLALSFVMLAIALAPGVPTVLATVRTSTTNEDAKLNQPLAQQSCAAFENWFLDPSCRQPHAKKKAARMKRHREG